MNYEEKQAVKYLKKQFGKPNRSKLNILTVVRSDRVPTVHQYGVGYTKYLSSNCYRHIVSKKTPEVQIDHHGKISLFYESHLDINTWHGNSFNSHETVEESNRPQNIEVIISKFNIQNLTALTNDRLQITLDKFNSPFFSSSDRLVGETDNTEIISSYLKEEQELEEHNPYLDKKKIYLNRIEGKFINKRTIRNKNDILNRYPALKKNIDENQKNNHLHSKYEHRILSRHELFLLKFVYIK